jgi:hypothetical protein
MSDNKSGKRSLRQHGALNLKTAPQNERCFQSSKRHLKSSKHTTWGNNMKKQVRKKYGNRCEQVRTLKQRRLNSQNSASTRQNNSLNH